MTNSFNPQRREWSTTYGHYALPGARAADRPVEARIRMKQILKDLSWCPRTVFRRETPAFMSDAQRDSLANCKNCAGDVTGADLNDGWAEGLGTCDIARRTNSNV